MDVIYKIDGLLFEKLLIGGVVNLKTHMQEINDLNVFPIPDGDTGSNMFMTINGGISNMKSLNDNSISKKARALADGMMLNARGNSGVILSQLFNGLAMGMNNLNEVNIENLNYAFKSAYVKAYSSVIKPVEGTILTVAREAYEYANDNLNQSRSINDYFCDYINAMKKSLESTPELLHVLKEAGVVDSGGAGLLCIFEGMNDILLGKVTEEDLSFDDNKSLDFSKFDENSVMIYGYCTELLLQLQTSKVDVNNFNEDVIINYLNTIGDSLVVFKKSTVIKIHVHTLTPAKVLEYCQQFGEFLSIKVENMTLQHNDNFKEKPNEKPIEKTPKKKYGIVAVATGKGLIDTFKEIGADYVIDGGQGHNPSTKTFIEAFDKVNAENIFVFPNNSNIIMTALEAKDLYKGANIYVINTKDFGQGYAALSVLDLSVESQEGLQKLLNEAKDNVATGLVTKAVRDANINNVDIHKDNYIGFCDKLMLTSNESRIKTYLELLEKLNVQNKMFVINVFGKEVNNKEVIEVEKIIKTKYPQLEIFNIDGGQDVYDYIIIVQ